MSGAGEAVSSLASVEVDEAPKSADDGLGMPLTWADGCDAGDFILEVDCTSTAVDAELCDAGSFPSSSIESAHLAPFNSDFKAAAGALWSFEGVLAPVPALLDSVGTGFDAPRAACAYENGADFATSDCEDVIFQILRSVWT